MTDEELKQLENWNPTNNSLVQILVAEVRRARDSQRHLGVKLAESLVANGVLREWMERAAYWMVDNCAGDAETCECRDCSEYRELIGLAVKELELE